MSAWWNKARRFCVQSEERGTWPGRFDFLVTAIGYTTNLGILWRFPYLVYRNGGAVFFGPFDFFMGVMGLPLVFYQISLGQFTSSGTLTCWNMTPIFQGVGLAMVVTSAIVAVYFSVMLGWAFYYLFASFTSNLPWAKCGNEWNKECIGILPENRRCIDYGWNASADGGCYDDFNWIKAIWNNTGNAMNSYNNLIAKASDEYFRGHVLRSQNSSGLDDLGPVVWHIALCNLLVWVLVAVVLSKSIKLYGKVSYFTTIFPLFLLFVFFAFGLTLDGHQVGYEYFTIPDRSKIHSYRTWQDAAMEVFYSLSLSYGGLITLGSYNRFTTDTYRDSIVICGVCTGVNILSGFTVFFLLGAMAKRLDITFDNVVSVGTDLAFVVMPHFFTTTSVPTLWSILWFLMVLTLGIGFQLGSVETVITGVLDVFPKLRRLRLFVVIVVCALLFLLGLPYTTEGGRHLIGWIDFSMAGWSMFLLPVYQLVALLFYGIPRFLTDVEIMTGRHILGCLPVIIGKLVMGFHLYMPTLAAVIFLSVASLIDPWGPDWPMWAQQLGKVISWSSLVFVICGAVLAIIMSIVKQRRTFNKDWFAFVTPTTEWGPVKPEHRSLVRSYVPWFAVYPSAQDQNVESNMLNVVSQ